MKTPAILIAMALAAGCAANAGVIERACMKSERKTANRALCGCIQQVADVTLDRRDQRAAAKFFDDPHRAQEVRQSDKPGHEVFWKKYASFGQTAESYCG